MSNSTNLVGAFSVYTCEISSEVQEVFNEATVQILGVKYTAVAVSQQAVAGMNYNFFCNSVASTRYPLNGAAIVSIYKPLNNERAHVTNIRNI